MMLGGMFDLLMGTSHAAKAAKAQEEIYKRQAQLMAEEPSAEQILMSYIAARKQHKRLFGWPDHEKHR